MIENFVAQASIGKINYITDVKLNGFDIRVDEPIEIGGSNTAPTPFDYLYTALASCVAITLKMYVDRKQWDVGKIYVNIIPKETEEGELQLMKKIAIEKDITEDQRKRIALIADKCPVAKLLKAGVKQETMF